MRAIFKMDGRSVLHLQGEGAKALLKRLLCGNVRSMTEGTIVFSPMLNMQGGTMDNVMVYCDHENSYWLIVHECSREKDLRHIRREITPDVTAEDLHDMLCLYAVISEGGNLTLSGAPVYFAAQTDHLGADSWLACVQREDAPAFETDMAQRGGVLYSQAEMDTMMMENGVPAYGRELDDTINPLEVGLGKTVHLERPGFIGREALVAAGVPRRGVIGLLLTGEGAKRGQNVIHRDKDVGVVTSVCFSPRMQSWIALALVEKPYQDVGRKLRVENGEELIDAYVSALPFRKPEEEPAEESN